MRLLYSVCLALLLPILVLRLTLRALRSDDYRQGWRDRFGLIEPLPDGPPVLWVHAVSAGEVQAAIPLVRILQARYRHCRMLVTTTTPTGRSRLKQVFGESVIHRYLPLDLPVFLQLFLRRARPVIGILMETELWPNLVHLCSRSDVPLVLANARLSQRSARGYARVRSLTRNMLSGLSLVAAQSAEDASRLIALGTAPQRVTVTGNIKLDVHPAASVSEAAQVLRRSWGQHRSVWIAASTHAGEEEIALDVHRWLKARIPDALLILVPRHPDRADGVETLCRRAGYTVVRRSQTIEPEPVVDVYLGDTMGELPVMYAASDVAFVGGSLVEIGGHNMLEPAALGVAVVMGPHMFNFAELAARIIAAGAGRQVEDAGQLQRELRRLLADADARHAMGERGREFVAANRGAVEELATAIHPLLEGGDRARGSVSEPLSDAGSGAGAGSGHGTLKNRKVP